MHNLFSNGHCKSIVNQICLMILMYTLTTRSVCTGMFKITSLTQRSISYAINCLVMQLIDRLSNRSIGHAINQFVMQLIDQ